MQNAINTGEVIFFPAGTYLINITIATKIICEGEGSNATFLSPYNSSLAAITYTSQSPFWTYHSEFRNIGFLSSSKTGIGFTFSKSNPASYTTNDQYAGNVKFFGCDFKGFEKAVQFPFGNIGTEFYSCGFHDNKYGVYSLNNKFGGIMHAGNKYFYAGEMSGNDCAVYVHNTADGFGGFNVRDVIFEDNAIAAYIFTTSTTTPIQFDGCWNENNGQNSGTATISLDQWSGASVTTTNFTTHSFIFDGSGCKVLLNGIFFNDVHLKASNSTLTVTNSRAEYASGVSAAPSLVDEPTSRIDLINPTTDFGVPIGERIFTIGYPVNLNYLIDSNATYSLSRFAVVPHRSAKALLSPGRGSALPLDMSTQLGFGAFSPINGNLVPDGILYPDCNEWTIPFTSASQYMGLVGSGITTIAGWYVTTVDLKVTNGSPRFFVWDRNTAQMAAGLLLPSLNHWYTVAAIGESLGGQTLYFDIGGTSSTATVRASAWQLLYFESRSEAENYLSSLAYADA